jgi:hypothetical protein
LIIIGTEISRLKHLTDTKYDINMKLTAAAFSLVWFVYGARAGPEPVGPTPEPEPELGVW